MTTSVLTPRIKIQFLPVGSGGENGQLYCMKRTLICKNCTVKTVMHIYSAKREQPLVCHAVGE